MIHDTAQGQTQFNLCAELRAQVVELAKERDECRNQYFGLEGMYEDIQKERDMWRDTDLRDAARVDELAAQLAASKAQIAAYATKLGAESDQVCYLEDQFAALTQKCEELKRSTITHDEWYALHNELAASQALVEEIRAIVAKMRSDLKAAGGFDNRFNGQPAVNIREYILDLEDALALPAKDSTLHEQLAASQARVELLERDDKSGDYETLYAQTVVELERSQAREAKLREALEHYRNMASPRSWDGSPANAALALPTDDTALQQRLAEEREKCAQQCDDEASIEGIAQRCATKIRSMK